MMCFSLEVSVCWASRHPELAGGKRRNTLQSWRRFAAALPPTLLRAPSGPTHDYLYTSVLNGIDGLLAGGQRHARHQPHRVYLAGRASDTEMPDTHAHARAHTHTHHNVDRHSRLALCPFCRPAVTSQYQLSCLQGPLDPCSTRSDNDALLIPGIYTPKVQGPGFVKWRRG
mgnify:CR=1 FL=1